MTDFMGSLPVIPLSLNLGIIAGLSFLHSIGIRLRERLHPVILVPITSAAYWGITLIAYTTPVDFDGQLVFNAALPLAALGVWFAGPPSGLLLLLIHALFALYPPSFPSDSLELLGIVVPVLGVMSVLQQTKHRNMSRSKSTAMAAAILGILTFGTGLFSIGSSGLGALSGASIIQSIFFIIGCWFMQLPEDNSRLLKRSAEREARYRHLFEYAPVALWEEDFSQLFHSIRKTPEEFTEERKQTLLAEYWKYLNLVTIRTVNRKAVQMLGAKDASDLLGRLELTATPDLADTVVQEIFAIRDGLHSFNQETTVKDLSGKVHFVVLDWSVLPGGNSDYSRVLVSTTDTTTIVEQALNLQRTLDHKELLIREIHHRVRNSLSIAYSLLGLQRMKLDDESTMDMLTATMNRIQAISLIHTQLYQNREILALDIKRYLENLISILQPQTSGGGIFLEAEAPAMNLHIDQVLPLGIIINELVTNAQKHAFPPDQRPDKPAICVQFNPEGEHGVLTVQDNGVGLNSEVFNVTSSSSLGITLIKALGDQLQADLSYGYFEGWSAIRMTFPLQQI